MYQWFSDALAREFQEEQLLKRSSRGSVQLLRHKGSGQRFVLRRFRGNAEVYRQLLRCTCKNLPEIFETASREEEQLVLEEYIQGDTLDFLLKGALFTPGETRQIVTQVCTALWVLHSLGAVHRDVKPENIILRGSEAVLIDFDAARLYKPEETGDTQVLGTTGFAAPEQYGLSQTDRRADIYAVGILMNVMLTGEHPSRRLASDRLGRVVERCTQVSPDKRYPDVIKLMEAL